MFADDNDIESREHHLPLAAGIAFAAAAQRVLASGQSVLQSHDGGIFEIFPNGERRFVKPIEPPIQVIPGSTFITQ